MANVSEYGSYAELPALIRDSQLLEHWLASRLFLAFLERVAPVPGDLAGHSLYLRFHPREQSPLVAILGQVKQSSG
jgi:hypothetical protein